MTQSARARRMAPSGITIEINQPSSAVRIDTERCEQALRLLCHDAGYQRGQFSIALVGDQQSRALHGQYLGDDTATDVLSFVLERQAGYIEGEIIANAELAARQAAVFGWEPADELLLYIVHGALHIVGYDDRQEDEREQLFARQREIFVQLGYDPQRVSAAITTAARP